VSAALNANGGGMEAAMNEVRTAFESGEIKLSAGTRYQFGGEAESFLELAQNMLLAILMSILLIYLVLACLYESFITPITIMIVIPLAACGAIYALAITGKSIDIFSLIGCILLMGIATKNSILLVDYIQQLRIEGVETSKAIVHACVVRLRPILMTALALIAGMIPLAIGLNEASSQRTSMGVAVIGGTITSTILTLFLIPAIYDFMLRFGAVVNRIAFKILSQPSQQELRELNRAKND
jgi:HAE1 family hydrophobic/amphiphilic exporter-1